MDGLHFNTDITSYTLDELFSLLDIKITDTSDVVSIKQLIIDRTEQYIKQFTDAKRDNMVIFFKNIQSELLGKSNEGEKTTSQQTVITFDKEYNPLSDIIIQGNSQDVHDSRNGAGNPLHRKTITQLLSIDSRFRHNYEGTTSTDYLIDLPYTLQHVVEVKLCDLELPTTYYPINATLQNNYFWFSTYTSSQIATNTPNIYYIYIPSGNYYYENLVTLINTTIKYIDDPIIMNEFSYDLPVSFQIDLSYNNVNGIGNGTGKSKFGIITTNNTINNEFWNIVRIELNFEAPPILGVEESIKVTDSGQMSLYYTKHTISKERRIGWMLGYRKSFYSTLAYQLSESVVNLLGPQYVYLIVNDFNKNRNTHFVSTSSKGLLPDDIIARVSIKAPIFNIQTQNDFSVYAETRQYFGPVKINKLHIRLVDEFSRILDLNNADFSFTLRITRIYSST
jgi:hypothetical protein